MKMEQIKTILFPFRRRYRNLHERWWHRLFLVAFTIFLLICLSSSFVLIFDSTENNISNTRYISIGQFTKNFTGTGNAVKPFLELDGGLGCIEKGTGVIEYLSTYDWEGILTSDTISKDLFADGSYCSPNLRANIPDFINQLEKNAPKALAAYADTDIEKILIERLDAKAERLCFIPDTIKCGEGDSTSQSDSIVKYTSFTASFYIQIAIYSILITLLISLFIQFLYYFGFLYIILGKKNG